LEVFGSAARDDSMAAAATWISLCGCAPHAHGYADRYLAFAEALEDSSIGQSIS